MDQQHYRNSTIQTQLTVKRRKSVQNKNIPKHVSCLQQGTKVIQKKTLYWTNPIQYLTDYQSPYFETDAEKHPYHMMLPPCFTEGMVLARFPPDVTLGIQAKEVSSDQRILFL
jgi:hypothetical protein